MAAKKHYFVFTANGTSAHRHGPFATADAAREWAKIHYAAWQCWLVPAEYIGSVPAQPLDEHGHRIQEG